MIGYIIYLRFFLLPKIGLYHYKPLLDSLLRHPTDFENFVFIFACLKVFSDFLFDFFIDPRFSKGISGQYKVIIMKMMGGFLKFNPNNGGGKGNPLQYSCLEKSNGQRSLPAYSPWGRKELDTTG